jgi:hypothetical protein
MLVRRFRASVAEKINPSNVKRDLFLKAGLILHF